MSALGQKQTFFIYAIKVRFRGQSGPFSLPGKESANSHKQTFKKNLSLPENLELSNSKTVISHPQIPPFMAQYFPFSYQGGDMTYSGKEKLIISPEIRKTLEKREVPYWWRFARGRSLGYRNGVRQTYWKARIMLISGKYKFQRLGAADDEGSPDGKSILSFTQALEKAEEWCETFKDAIPRFMDFEIPIYPDLPQTPPYTVAHAIVDYLRWSRENRRSFRKVYYTARTFILPDLGCIPLVELDTKTVRAWFDGIAESPIRVRNLRGKGTAFKEKSYDPEAIRKRRNSANHVLAMLKACLNRAYQHGYIDSDLAWSRVRFFWRVDHPRIRYLEKDQCRDLVSVCPPDLGNLVQGALMTGCRLGELRSMRVQDFLPDLKRVLVNDTKRDMLRHTSLSKEGMAFFSKLAKKRNPDQLMFLRSDGRSWRGSTHYRKFKAACVGAGIEPPIRFHGLRHTYASQAAMAGIPLVVIAKQLGHRDTLMVERHYSHLGSSFIDDVIQKQMPRLISKKPRRLIHRR